jgi:putative oxidoreductase
MRRNNQLTNNSTESTWIAFTRILLGILVIWKGLLFTQDTSELQVAVQQTGVGEYAGFLLFIAAVVSILTLVSGIFIMVGLFARIASYTQMVLIVLGIAFVYSTGIQRNNFETISTIIILSMLMFIAQKGSGSISFDKVIERNRQLDIGVN